MDVKTMTNAEVKREALSWVNAFRTEHGLSKLDRLPKGIPGNGEGCVLGEATGLLYSLDGYASVPDNLFVSLGAFYLLLPEVVQELEDRFEHDGLPELVRRKTPRTIVLANRRATRRRRQIREHASV